MDNLPDEILLEIFLYFDIKYLNNTLANVSNRWNYLITTSCLNTYFELQCEEDLQFLGQYPNKIRIKAIEINYEVDLINSLFENLALLCPNLTSLTVSKCNLLSERHVYRLTRCFPNLVHIDVFLLSYFISQTFVNAVKNMKSIVLNNHIEDTALRAISDTCKNLKEIHMYGNVQYYPLCHLHIFLASKYQTLQRLSLRCCEVNNGTCNLIVACISLTHLRLYHCWLMTDTGLIKLSTLNKLQSLHVTGLKLVTQKGFNRFISDLDMEVMQDLNLSSTPFNDTSATLLCAKKQYLRRLELWQCKKLTCLGISYIITGLKQLFTLDLDMELPDEIVQLVINESTLKYLRLSKRASLFIDIPSDRNLFLFDAFAYSRKCFRGNGEGYSANLLCYTYHKNYLSIEDDYKDRTQNIKRRLISYASIF